MRNMFKWKECGIEPFCADIANFYYPTAPCVVADNHPIFESAPHTLPPGPDKRHWWTMTDKWDFSSEKFKDARKAISEFVDEEVKGPVDVILGYSQGAAATTQVLNEVYSGQWPDNCLKGVAAAIFLGCPHHPRPSNEVGAAVEALFCNGDKDPLTSLKGAKEHATNSKIVTFSSTKAGMKSIRIIRRRFGIFFSLE